MSGKFRKVSAQVHLPVPLHDKLRAFSNEQRRSISSVIEQALREFFGHQVVHNPPPDRPIPMVVREESFDPNKPIRPEELQERPVQLFPGGVIPFKGIEE